MLNYKVRTRLELQNDKNIISRQIHGGPQVEQCQKWKKLLFLNLVFLEILLRIKIKLLHELAIS